MEFIEKFNYWCTSNIFDENTHKELENIKNDEKEIKERFYKDLEFGTAGLRGIIGAGTNRMNKYTVTKATQGLANYILKTGNAERGVAIAYDSRNFSPEFSMWAALCLNANGIKTYRFDSLRPTPMLSFAVRELGCIAGIVVTASHNPPEYNGYKVYWEDGAQIVPPIDGNIISEVNKITDYSEIKMMELEEATAKGLYNVIGEEVDKKYLASLKSLVLNPDAISKHSKEIKIVYTPLHGTGNIPVQTILKDLGFENVYVVPEQEKPDGNFPTVSYPNPEDPKAFSLALELAKKVDADLILATDPDADRLGVYVKDYKNNDYVFFTGNMSALFIAEYEISQMKEKNMLPENGAMVTTIVSSNLTQAIAKEYDLKLFETLTGFKYIGEKIKQFEQDNSYKYVFGFEESYGCLVGTHARDKDAIVAVMATCEAAAYYKSKGISVLEQMENIYKKYGYYKEGQIALTFKGIEGAEKMKSMMNNLRENPPMEVAGLKVIAFRDYLTNEVKNFELNSVCETGLPKSNVLYFELDNSSWCCVRPSGTEPKIKFYFGVCSNSNEDSLNKLNELKAYWENL
ncbi:MAG: phospho-sugar mutase [Clostridiales bacterium]|nr:phospho-sugar mutase [Clostridiales bacterium]